MEILITHKRTKKYIDVISSEYTERLGFSHKTYETKDCQTSIWLEKKPNGKNFVDNLVRINKTKRTFEKRYLPNWTTELFRVIHIPRSSPQTVQLEDLGTERIEGSFYMPEIQPIKDSDIYEIETFDESKQKKPKEFDVYWKGYP